MSNFNDRSTPITIDGKEYRLLLTTRATKAIAGKYGGFENLGDKMLKSGNYETLISDIVWLIVLLANQTILIEKLRDNNSPTEFLTEEAVELLTSPADFAAYKNAITDCLIKGTRRNVESEEDEKKQTAG